MRPPLARPSSLVKRLFILAACRSMVDFQFVIDPLARSIAQEAYSNPLQFIPPTPLDGAVVVLDHVGKGLSLFSEEDVIPPAAPSHSRPPRPVIIGCHPISPVSGPLGVELERVVKQTGKPVLDPTYHWAVFVGDYYHQLNPRGISGGLSFIHIQTGYQNGKVGDGRAEWSYQLQVGYTKFNDAAVVDAGHAVVQSMPESYDPIVNNCQAFVIGLVQLISPDASMSDVETIGMVVDHIENDAVSKEGVEEEIELVRAQNVPSVNAAMVMQAITPLMG